MWKVLLGMLVVAGMAAATYGWRAESSVSVSTVSVVRGSLESKLQLTGTVINDRTVTLTALLDGQIKTIRARQGDKVEANEVLAKLDSRNARAMVNKASAELVMQEQIVESTRRELKRVERLSRVGGVSKQAQDESRDAQFEARAALNSAKATLILNSIALDNALIRSPFSGTVIEQYAETGQWLEAGTPLFKVVAAEGAIIEANVSASDWPRLSVGQRVILSSNIDAEAEWQSSITWIAPSAVAVPGQGKNVAVRIPPTSNAPLLLLGQDVQVDVLLQQNDDVLIVPLDVLQEDQGGETSVFLLQNGIARRHMVTVGLTSLDEAEITAGLVEGERIIVPAGIPLQDGQTVQNF